jgi:hypothetical protein
MLKFRNQKGQALLIVVLAMVVALTVGLSVVSRSIINLRNSQQEIDSQQALSAAEAGVEQSIKIDASLPNTSLSGSGKTFYQTSLVTVSGATTFLLNGNNKVSKDDATYIWLTPYSFDSSKLFLDSDSWSGSIDLYWGDSPTACNNAALEVAVISGSRAAPVTTRYVYDPCSDRVSQNHFAAPDSTGANPPISGTILYSKVTIPGGITNGFLVRVVPLYADSHIGVLGRSNNPAKPLPSQGSMVVSTGTTNTNVIKKLNVFQGYPEIPAELFPFTIFWP